jgi:hypothetical protein
MRYLISRVLMRESLSGGAHARSEVLVSDDSAGLTISFSGAATFGTTSQHREDSARTSRNFQLLFIYSHIILFVLFFSSIFLLNLLFSF